MRKLLMGTAATVAALAATGCATMPSGGSAFSAGCNRDCLIDLTDSYLAALAAHDPSAVPLAANLRTVENLERIEPGEGLWSTTTAEPTTFKVYVPDTELQQVGFIGVMGGKNADGEDSPVMIALRLKLAPSGEIVEAEHLVQAVSERSMANLNAPRPGLLTEVPPAQRLSAQSLRRIGSHYYDALDDNNGSRMPFAPDCERRENGITTAGPKAGPGPVSTSNQAPVARDCAGQMDSQSFIYIENIDDRRMVGADPVTGLVMGFSHFRHSFTNLPYTVIHSDGSTSERNAENMPYNPFDMPAAHLSKVGPDHLVHEIEAVGVTGIPFNAPTGWEE